MKDVWDEFGFLACPDENGARVEMNSEEGDDQLRRVGVRVRLPQRRG